MATEPALYDLVVLLNPAMEEDRRLKIMGDLEVLIDQHGTIVSRHEWGLRKTAFQIRKQADADYHLIQFNGSNELLEAMDHALKITDGVLRHRIIKLRPGTPPPPDLRAAAFAEEPAADERGERMERSERLERGERIER
jgi:small subunit ribosomal protein S6